MPKLAPHLIFNGDCADAFQFYAQLLDGNIESLRTYGDSTDDVPPGYDNQVMQALIRIDGQALMGSDTPPEEAYEDPQGFTVSLTYPSLAKTHAVFDALAADGFVTMPLHKTFLAQAFGTLIDRFGTPWMISCDFDASSLR